MLVVKSANRKLGSGVSAIYAQASTCPADCPMSRLCYAKKGHTAMAFRRAKAWPEIISDIRCKLPVGGLLRLCVSGDMPNEPEIMSDLIHACHERAGQAWGYSHKVPGFVSGNVVVRESHEDGKRALDRQRAGFPVAVACKEWSDKPSGFLSCPNQLSGGRITCKDCRLCWTRPDKAGQGRTRAFVSRCIDNRC
jgi:hypothetical protein